MSCRTNDSHNAADHIHRALKNEFRQVHGGRRRRRRRRVAVNIVAQIHMDDINIARVNLRDTLTKSMSVRPAALTLGPRLSWSLSSSAQRCYNEIYGFRRGRRRAAWIGEVYRITIYRERESGTTVRTESWMREERIYLANGINGSRRDLRPNQH